MGFSFGIKHFLAVLVGLNLITLFVYYQSARSNQKKELRRIETQQNFISSLTPKSELDPETATKIDLNLQSIDQLQSLLEDTTPERREVIELRIELLKTQSTIDDLKAKNNQEIQNSNLKYTAETRTNAYLSKMIGEMNPFRKLGLYETMSDKYCVLDSKNGFYKNVQYYNIKHNKGYCDTVDLYNLHNPNNIFHNMNFISDYGFDESLIRNEVMKKMGNDVMPGILMGTTKHNEPKYDLAINATMTFLKVANIHSMYEMNKELACLSQMYNHIPGSGVIARKDLLAEMVNNYLQKYVDRPQCIRQDTFFPRTYKLDVKAECQAFFNIINSKKYQQNKKQEPIQYLIKVGNAHRASGVFLLDKQLENQIRDTYKNGNECGKVTKPQLAQTYISNPLLLDRQNKFDFRMYMLIASVNPLIVYYHDGFLRVSLSKYDKNSTEKNVHLTNTHLSKEIFKKAAKDNLYEGMTEKELRDYQMWTMEDLQNYLLETGKIQDINWLDNYLKPKFKKAFIHLARIAEQSLYKSSSVFEMFGLDFVIDENFEIWVIECNPSPQMVGTNDRKTQFLVQMIKDLFEIQHAYLRSRMKRVFSFVKEMETRTQAGETLDYKQLREDFDKVNINKLEPEFHINKDNSFELILDKNIGDPEAYYGHLNPECINI